MIATGEDRLRAGAWQVALALLAACLALLAGPEASRAQGLGKAVLVLDSTAEMRVLLGSESKLVSVAAVLPDVLQHHVGHLDLGLFSYGHQASGQRSCDNYDPMLPVGAIEVERFNAAVAILKAKGDAPISLALEKAVAAQGMAGDRGTVILVAGGPQSCPGDPCVLTAKLGGEDRVRIHVIAVDAGEDGEKLRTLRCIASNTNGTFRKVGSSIELAAALDEALTQAAAYLPAGAAAGQAQAGASPADQSPEGANLAAQFAPTITLPEEGAPQEAAPATISLSALLTEAGPQISSDLVWRVFEVKPGAGAPRLVSTSQEPAPTLALPAGDYMVNVAYGRAFLNRRIKLGPQGTSEPFVLNAGGLSIKAVLPSGDAEEAKAVICDVYTDERDQSGNRAKVVSGVRPGTIVRLNAGLYHVVSTYGENNAVVQSDVVVEAGRLTEATFTHTGSLVGFRLVEQAGGEALTDTAWRILDEAGELVGSSAGAIPTHILAPGNYKVEAQRDGKVYTMAFTVEPRTPLQVEVVEADAQ